MKKIMIVIATGLSLVACSGDSENKEQTSIDKFNEKNAKTLVGSMRGAKQKAQDAKEAIERKHQEANQKAIDDFNK